MTERTPLSEEDFKTAEAVYLEDGTKVEPKPDKWEEGMYFSTPKSDEGGGEAEDTGAAADEEKGAAIGEKGEESKDENKDQGGDADADTVKLIHNELLRVINLNVIQKVGEPTIKKGVDLFCNDPNRYEGLLPATVVADDEDSGADAAAGADEAPAAAAGTGGRRRSRRKGVKKGSRKSKKGARKSKKGGRSRKIGTKRRHRRRRSHRQQEN